jgi:Uma2 family endonuclease
VAVASADGARCTVPRWTSRQCPACLFVAYARWPEPVSARENAWNVVPELAVETVSPTNLAEEIDDKITDYF